MQGKSLKQLNGMQWLIRGYQRHNTA
uniref:Uncharacterized protein n=1 Tax=Rhizophora mucronata TaxID=61149 RepID=A0A2P2PH36_RHIMU